MSKLTLCTSGRQKSMKLRGDSSKARRELNWKPKTSFKKLVGEMMESDLKEII